MTAVSVPHAWVFQVLRDLKDYALANDMPELAQKADEALAVAAREIGGGDGREGGFRH